MLTHFDRIDRIERFVDDLMDQIEEACEEDRDVTIAGNGVNCFEALSTLRPVQEFIRSLRA